MAFEKMTLIVKHTRRVDDYYEDDDGRECHTMDSTSFIDFVEVPFRDAGMRAEEIGESNADNPPYDEYEVLCAFDAETKQHYNTAELRRQRSHQLKDELLDLAEREASELYEMQEQEAFCADMRPDDVQEAEEEESFFDSLEREHEGFGDSEDP